MGNIYEIGECSYCGEDCQIVRPTPFMADIMAKAKMCECCWEETKKEYAASNGEHIDSFDSCQGYAEIKKTRLVELYEAYEAGYPEMDIRKYAVEHLGYKSCIDWSKDQLIDEFGYGYCLYLAERETNHHMTVGIDLGEKKDITIRSICTTEGVFSEGDAVTVKRKNGRCLKNCVIEKIFDSGFVYWRRTKKGYCYSQVLLDEIEILEFGEESKDE